MSIGSSGPTFTVYDLITRIVPGGLFVAVLLILVSADSISTTPSNFLLLLFLISSFIVGEFVNIIRLSTLDVPLYFRLLLYELDEDEDYLYLFDHFRVHINEWDSNLAARVNRKIPSSRLASLLITNKSSLFGTFSIFEYRDDDIIEMLESSYELPEDSLGTYDVYELITSELSGHESRRTRRLRTIYVFTRNLQISLLLSLLLNGLIIISYYVGMSGLPDYIPLFSGGLLIGSFIAYLITWVYLRKTAPVGRVYTQSLLTDYLVFKNS